MQNDLGKKKNTKFYAEKVEENGAFQLALLLVLEASAKSGFLVSYSCSRRASQGSGDVVHGAAASRPPSLCSSEQLGLVTGGCPFF